MKKRFVYILFLSLVSVNLANAQCYPDRHSTSWYEGWISCETSSNPNAAYGDSHWIMYDFGYEYVLGESKLWNTNEPNRLNNGISEYYLDYSLDGATWTSIGTFSLNRASGLSTYEGEDGPDFSSTKARYVLITAIANYGGDCFGFSELKINITDPLEETDQDGFNALVYPNPFINNVTLKIASLNEEAPITYTLHDILGRVITQSTIELQENVDTYEVELNGHSLAVGIYILNIEQDGTSRSFKLIKREE